MRGMSTSAQALRKASTTAASALESWMRASASRLAREPLAGALERAVDGGRGELERVAGLARRPAEPFAQREHGALARGQQLHRGDVGEAEPLAGDRLFLGRRQLVEEAVGIGLQVRVERLDRLALLEHPQRDVGGDPVQPGAQRRARLVAGQAAPGAQQGLLQRVVGVVEVAEHAVGVHVQRAAVRAGELDEGLLVAVAGRRRAAGSGRGRRRPRAAELRPWRRRVGADERRRSRRTGCRPGRGGSAGAGWGRRAPSCRAAARRSRRRRPASPNPRAGCRPPPGRPPRCPSPWAWLGWPSQLGGSS